MSILLQKQVPIEILWDVLLFGPIYRWGDRFRHFADNVSAPPISLWHFSFLCMPDCFQIDNKCDLLPFQQPQSEGPTKCLIYHNGIPHVIPWIKGSTHRVRGSTMNIWPRDPFYDYMYHSETAGLMECCVI